MTIRLYGLGHMPPTLPDWQTILRDLGDPPAGLVAKALGVSPRTVYRWNGSSGPRVASLALFWLTRWGRSAVNAQATNDALVAVGYLRALQDELAAVRRQLAHVLSLDASGSANQPLVGGPHAIP